MNSCYNWAGEAVIWSFAFLLVALGVGVILNSLKKDKPSD